MPAKRTSTTELPENKGEVTCIISLGRREGVTREQFDAFWANGHAPIQARMPGIWFYKTRHVEAYRRSMWSVPESIAVVEPPQFHIDGFCELAFRSPEDQAANFRAADGPGGYTHVDAHHVFWSGLFYIGHKTSRTLRDGRMGETNILCFRFRDGVDRAEGHAWVSAFAERAAASGHVSRVRVHLNVPTELGDGLNPFMKHAPEPGEGLDAILEISAEDALELTRAFHDDLGIEDEAARLLAAAYVYRVYQVHTFVDEGRITQVGIRTPFVIDIIEQLGAVNQLTPEMDRLFLTGELDPARLDPAAGS